MKEIKVSFDYIVENCETIGDLRKLDKEIRGANDRK